MKKIAFAQAFILSCLLILSTNSAMAYNWQQPDRSRYSDPSNNIQQILGKLKKFNRSADKKNSNKVNQFLNKELVPAFAFKTNPEGIINGELMVTESKKVITFFS